MNTMLANKRLFRNLCIMVIASPLLFYIYWLHWCSGSIYLSKSIDIGENYGPDNPV